MQEFHCHHQRFVKKIPGSWLTHRARASMSIFESVRTMPITISPCHWPKSWIRASEKLVFCKESFWFWAVWFPLVEALEVTRGFQNSHWHLSWICTWDEQENLPRVQICLVESFWRNPLDVHVSSLLCFSATVDYLNCVEAASNATCGPEAALFQHTLIQRGFIHQYADIDCNLGEFSI